MRSRLLAVVGDLPTLQCQMPVQQLAHVRVGDPVRRVHHDRREAACELVFAAGAGFEAPQAFAQTIRNALIEAEFEMQTGVVLAATPIAPVERVVAAETEGDGHRLTAVAGDECNHPSTEVRPSSAKQAAEKAA
jgi:hypothetical protein